MKLLSSAGDSYIGCRDGQEDSFAIWEGETKDGEPELLMVVADGMGGHARGEVASTLVVEAFVESFSHSALTSPDRLRKALFEANARLARAVSEAPDLAGMGTTLAACHLCGQSLHWISVGDSPLWLCQASGFGRLNADHSMRADLDGAVARGEMTAWSASVHPYRNMLRAAVMGDEIGEIDCPATPMICRPDDMVVLASDGIFSVPTETLHQIVATLWDKAPAKIVQALLRSVIDANARKQDNVTILVGKFANASGHAVHEIPKGKSRAKIMGAWAILSIAVLFLIAAAFVNQV